VCTIAQTHFGIECNFKESETSKGGFPMTPQPSDWRALAERASKETDPIKLLTIVEVLNRVLQREEMFRHMSPKVSSS
jgi:hypothetical protein